MISRYVIIFFSSILLNALIPFNGLSQSSHSIPSSLIAGIEAKTAKYNKRIDRQTEKYLKRLEKQEMRLQKKLAKLDSARAGLLFSGTAGRYKQLRNILTQGSKQAVTGRIYLPNLDSMAISFSFLEQNEFIKAPAEKLQKASSAFRLMQEKLKNADDIRAYIRNRKQILKEALNENGLGSYLKKFSKEGYYYAKQIQEFRESWRNPGKVEQKLLTVLNKIPAFKKFAGQNGQLAGLFNLPGEAPARSTAGLQTIAGINNLVRSQVASAGPNAVQALQQNLQQAQSALSTLKAKVGASGGRDNDFEIPDFRANTQKTKTFWQRIAYTTDIQANRGSRFLPQTADVGLGIVYKINDKKQIGSQLVYKAGFGNGINHVRLTHEGVGYRFYTDLKFKGSIWVSAGYEKQYYNHIRNFSEWLIAGKWQESALAGISKKYKLKNRDGEMKLLYDFLWNKKPGGQRLLFRTGIHF